MKPLCCAIQGSIDDSLIIRGIVRPAAVEAVLKVREPSIWILVILDLANKVTGGGHPRAGGNRLAASHL
jgi:nanoRNase/pAp phosphatase (c-di-AMP/oligoRNAs hydrolase)